MSVKPVIGRAMKEFVLSSCPLQQESSIAKFIGVRNKFLFGLLSGHIGASALGSHPLLACEKALLGLPGVVGGGGERPGGLVRRLILTPPTVFTADGEISHDVSRLFFLVSLHCILFSGLFVFTI